MALPDRPRIESHLIHCPGIVGTNEGPTVANCPKVDAIVTVNSFTGRKDVSCLRALILKSSTVCLASKEYQPEEQEVIFPAKCVYASQE